MEDYAADLERFREAIGLDRMDLLGHSFGGLVAASYAAVHPDRVRRLIVDGIPNWLEKERIAGAGHFTAFEEPEGYRARVEQFLTG